MGLCVLASFFARRAFIKSLHGPGLVDLVDIRIKSSKAFDV